MSETKSKGPALDHTKVAEVLLRVVETHPDALKTEEKSGFTKVESVATGNKVYVQRRDDVREVHLSGFGAGRVGTVEPPRKNGKVQAWLDVNSADPYAVLEEVLVELATQQAADKPAAAPKAPRESKADKPKVAKADATSDADRVSRIKARVAALNLDGDAAPVPAVDAPADDAVVADA